jgi:methionine-rich copper-binding protein CopC
MLKSSDPADGARLAQPPETLTLVFSEEPEPALTRVEVLDPSGTSHREGEPEVAAGNPDTVRVDLDGLERHTYTVTWRTVSRVDGHATAGAFTFGVGEDPSSVAAPQIEGARPSGTSPLEVTGRWLLLTGLVVVSGAAWVASWVSPDRGPLRNLAAGGLGISLVGLVGLAEAQRSASAVGLAELFETRVGGALLWRGAALLLGGAALMLVKRWQRAWWVV